MKTAIIQSLLTLNKDIDNILELLIGTAIHYKAMQCNSKEFIQNLKNRIQL